MFKSCNDKEAYREARGLYTTGLLAQYRVQHVSL